MTADVETASTKITHDVIVVGGGMAGLTAAIGLADMGLKVAVIDRAPKAALIAEDYDGRSSAIAFASCQMLKALGVWKHLEEVAQPILEIRVSDGPSLLHLHFDNELLGDGPLGNMIENRHMRVALAKRASELENLQQFNGVQATSIETSAHNTKVVLDDNNELFAKLLVGADGRNSQIRKYHGINTTDGAYGQMGIVCSIEHELSHCGIAHERFLPSGPFAILPLAGNRSSLVWSEKEHLAKTIMNLGPKAFESEVQRRCGDFLGKVSVIGGRWCYPLTLMLSDKFIAERTALVGDAAHGMHPIAGQGLNMGLRDIAAFLEVVHEAHSVGLDIGSATTLENYASWRHFDNTTLLAVTDALTRLFSNDNYLLKTSRDIGLAVVDKIDPLKKFFMAHARGTVGTLPKLLKGEAL